MEVKADKIFKDSYLLCFGGLAAACVLVLKIKVLQLISGKGDYFLVVKKINKIILLQAKKSTYDVQINNP